MSTILPPLPSSIKQAIKNPAALTTKAEIQQLRASQRPLSPSEQAAAMSKVQDYLDALQGDLSSVQLYLQQVSTVTNPTSDTTAPGDITGLTVTGSFDPISGYATISVGVTPPSAPFTGCHIFIEVPDQSANPAFTVGISDLSGTDSVAGRWSPIDLAQQPYISDQQPWSLTFPIPDSVDRSGDLSCRVDVVSYTTIVENALVQFGQAGASPSVVFTLTRRVSHVPASGTNVTANMGPIVATVLPVDNSTGKLKTPVYVIVGSAPIGITGWVGQLVLTYGSADPTVLANQFPVGPIFNTAGPVNAGHDGITLPHSFAVDTPKTIQGATVWGITGLVDANGNYQWNNIVPNVTPSFPITLGTTTGTVDAASILLSSITATMAVTAGLFGVANNGIATINIQALAVTNPLLAALAVDAAKLATGAVTATKIGALAVGTAAIQLLAVDSTIIANASVSAAKIVNATITTTQIASATIVGANIASATIVDANIANVNASKITAGTISASISITAPTIVGGTITGATLVLNSGGVTTSLNNATVGGSVSGISVAQNSTSVTACMNYASFYGLDAFGTKEFSLTCFTTGGITYYGLLVLSNAGTTSIVLDASGPTISMGGQTGFTGTLAAAIAAGKNVVGGVIVN